MKRLRERRARAGVFDALDGIELVLYIGAAFVFLLFVYSLVSGQRTVSLAQSLRAPLSPPR